MPLLESRIVQMDENSFKMERPDGWFRVLTRESKAPKILSNGDWKAEINGETITAWAECGSKLVFQRGRIVSMQLKDRKFDYIYDGNKVSEIREGAVPLLRVEREMVSGEVTGLRLTTTSGSALSEASVRGSS